MDTGAVITTATAIIATLGGVIAFLFKTLIKAKDEALATERARIKDCDEEMKEWQDRFLASVGQTSAARNIAEKAISKMKGTN